MHNRTSSVFGNDRRNTFLSRPSAQPPQSANMAFNPGPNRTLVGPQPPPQMRHTMAPVARGPFYQPQQMTPQQSTVGRPSMQQPPQQHQSPIHQQHVQQQITFTPPQQPQQNPVVDLAVYDQLLDLYYKNPVDIKDVISLDLFKTKSALPNTVFEEADLFNTFDKIVSLVDVNQDDDR